MASATEVEATAEAVAVLVQEVVVAVQAQAAASTSAGTPEAATPAAVRVYLKEFLSDPRVVEIPRLIWWLILNGIILPFRSKQSAHKYATIWTPEGSPLKVHTEKQSQLLQSNLTARGIDVRVEMAMRYGHPSVPSVLDKLKADGFDRILLLPAYPQYSATTTASIFDAVFSHFANIRNVPELRLIKHYHDHDAYITALAQTLRSHWEQHGRADKLVMSFHGVPKRTLMMGDPYHCECYKTARLIAEKCGLSKDDYLVTFQSRFGKAEWLQPYTAPTLEKLAAEGVKRLDVMCPGFTSDCLETLEEIAMEAKADFLAAGGTEYRYIPCLNESNTWIDAMADLVVSHTQGWPVNLSDAQQQARLTDAETGRRQALALGANQ
jgi:ferrochelatase